MFLLVVALGLVEGNGSHGADGPGQRVTPLHKGGVIELAVSG